MKLHLCVPVMSMNRGYEYISILNISNLYFISLMSISLNVILNAWILDKTNKKLLLVC